MNSKNYTAENTKLFSYTGSKAKYKTKFDNLHTQVKIKKVDTYIEAFGGSLASMFHNLKYLETNRVVINDINLYYPKKNRQLFIKFNSQKSKIKQ